MFVFYRYISNFKLTINLVWSDIASSLHQDSIHGVNNLDPETPHQDPQKTCTRNSTCLQQGCMICSTPNTHIHNLDVALNGSNASPASPTIADRPQPLINHPQPLINHTILILIAAFQKAIQENDNFKLTSVDHQYAQAMKYNLDFFLYDRSNLQAVHKIDMQILNSHGTASTPPPALSPSASFKPSK